MSNIDFLNLSGANLPISDLLGKPVEVCIVSRDYRQTMIGLASLGIMPWRVYTFDPQTVTAGTYRGHPSDFSMKVCFAGSGDLTWEIIQPLSGPTIFAEHLEQHGEGLHHLAFDCNDLPWEDRIAAFEKLGFAVIQSGKWMDQNAFAFFGTEEATGAIFETYEFPPGFIFPEPEEWYPRPPE